MPRTLAPIPIYDPMARGSSPSAAQVGEPVFVTDNWARYLTELKDQIGKGRERLATVATTGIVASIAPTALNVGVITTGLFALTYFVRITSPAGVASSVTVSFGFTSDAVAITKSGTAITGNLVTTVGTETFALLCDAGSPITYSTTYASNPAGAMAHNLYITVEALWV